MRMRLLSGFHLFLYLRLYLHLHVTHTHAHARALSLRLVRAAAIADKHMSSGTLVEEARLYFVEIARARSHRAL